MDVSFHSEFTCRTSHESLDWWAIEKYSICRSSHSSQFISWHRRSSLSLSDSETLSVSRFSSIFYFFPFSFPRFIRPSFSNRSLQIACCLRVSLFFASFLLAFSYLSSLAAEESMLIMRASYSWFLPAPESRLSPDTVELLPECPSRGAGHSLSLVYEL